RSPLLQLITLCLLHFLFFLLHCSPLLRAPHSLPTRRSSDLITMQECGNERVPEIGWLLRRDCWHQGHASEAAMACRAYAFERLRSEEHTSELQSRFDLVCRLLLEKKKIEMRRTLSTPNGRCW